MTEITRMIGHYDYKSASISEILADIDRVAGEMRRRESKVIYDLVLVNRKYHEEMTYSCGKFKRFFLFIIGYLLDVGPFRGNLREKREVYLDFVRKCRIGNVEIRTSIFVKYGDLICVDRNKMNKSYGRPLELPYNNFELSSRWGPMWRYGFTSPIVSIGSGINNGNKVV